MLVLWGWWGGKFITGWSRRVEKKTLEEADEGRDHASLFFHGAVGGPPIILESTLGLYAESSHYRYSSLDSRLASSCMRG